MVVAQRADSETGASLSVPHEPKPPNKRSLKGSPARRGRAFAFSGGVGFVTFVGFASAVSYLCARALYTCIHFHFKKAPSPNLLSWEQIHESHETHTAGYLGILQCEII
jgi:hypothetical protein